MPTLPKASQNPPPACARSLRSFLWHPCRSVRTWPELHIHSFAPPTRMAPPALLLHRRRPDTVRRQPCQSPRRSAELVRGVLLIDGWSTSWGRGSLEAVQHWTLTRVHAATLRRKCATRGGLTQNRLLCAQRSRCQPRASRLESLSHLCYCAALSEQARPLSGEDYAHGPSPAQPEPLHG